MLWHSEEQHEDCCGIVEMAARVNAVFILFLTTVTEQACRDGMQCY